MKFIVAGSIALLVAGCGHMATSDHASTIPLIWKPTKSYAQSGTTDTTGRARASLRVEVTDNRGDPKIIGRNSEKIPPRKVTTRDNVAAFVSEHMKEVISSNGADVDDTGPVILKVEIQQFLVEETEIDRGDVRLKVKLVNSSGNDVWTGVTRGTSILFGRSYSAENYYEALSDSLVDAVRNLMRSETFHSALESTVREGTV